MKSKKNILVSAAIAGILSGSAVFSTTTHASGGGGKVKCFGGNATKEASSCGYIDAKGVPHDKCAGSASCKGKGVALAKSKKECAELQKKFMSPELLKKLKAQQAKKKG